MIRRAQLILWDSLLLNSIFLDGIDESIKKFLLVAIIIVIAASEKV